MTETFNQNSYESHYGRKLLQSGNSSLSSSSSFNASQPLFIGLLTAICVLTVAVVFILIMICYRCYLDRERKLKYRRKYFNTKKNTTSTLIDQPAVIPVSITPTYASTCSHRSSENLVSNHQISSINIVPSRRFHQSKIDAYLNDISTFQPANIDVNQLNSYLFVDLHSTSSETFPDNSTKQFMPINATANGFHTSAKDGNQGKHPQRTQRRTMWSVKRAHGPRFVMRERSLPNSISALPQLRQPITLQQKQVLGLDDTTDSSYANINEEQHSTNLSEVTDEYDDSHAYNIHQNERIQAARQEKPLINERIFPPSNVLPHVNERIGEAHCFEIVSTSRGDESDIQMPYEYFPIENNRIGFINESIVV